MLLLKNVAVLLHVITAAAWFGLGLRLAAQARTVASAEPSVAAALGSDGARTVSMMGLFSVLTLVFALVAFFAGGGFATYGPEYHTSLLLIVVLVGLQYGLIRPSWDKLVAGDTSARGRVAMGTGIGHLLWLVILVLMFWPQYFAPLF